jgi:hypothetical protein
MKAVRYFSIAICALLALAVAGKAATLESDQITRADLKAMKPRHGTPPTLPNGQAHARHGIPIDTLLNWNDHYFADGFDLLGNSNRHWFTNTVGNPPEQHGTTLINVPIVPVIVDLRNEDGSPRFVNGQPLVSSPEAVVDPLINSPVFAFLDWSSSSIPTQYPDAIQRASYFSRAKADWHTWLVPSVKPTRRMVLNKGTYFFVLNDDGSCCFLIIADDRAMTAALFPPTPTDTTTPMGAAINAGDITTKDISLFLFPNTLISEPGFCCFAGFHNWLVQFDPAATGNEKAYVMAFVNWLSPGIFDPQFQLEDATVASHEIVEALNDPFPGITSGHDETPWWLAPNGFCLAFLETGDPIEFLANSSHPVTMNGVTYHLQNHALVPWFKRESPSSALHGAYSYPDENVITALSPPQRVNCQ